MKTVILTLLIAVNTSFLAQVAVPTGYYFQDFGTTDILSWTNNATFPGWYETGTFQGHVDITTATPSNTGGFYTYECNGNNDQKIGTRASGGTGTLKYGVVLQNTTGAAISNIMVMYKGYQLSLAQNGNTNVIAFDYIISAAAPSITAGGGIPVAGLNFTQLQSNATSGSSQVAGYPCTQMSNLSACITAAIPNNSYILLRWTDVDDSGNDHHMAIDDIDVQFIATTLTVNSPAICASQPTTLTVTGASNYSWAPPAGLSTTTGSTVTSGPASTTVYTISASVGSCPAKTITSTVTVNSSPSITVNSTTLCSSASATLTATGAVTYTWSPSTGLSSVTGGTVAANPGSTIIYTVTGSAGCPITPGESTVTVISSPTLTPLSSQTICSSGSVLLTAGGAANYTWSPNTGLSSTTGNTVTASSLSTTVYTLNGSNGSCTAAPVTFTITVITGPTLSVNSATLCSGSSVVLTASGASSYAWTGASTLSSGTGGTVVASPASTTVYTLSGSIASCTATPVQATVTVLSNPSITVNSESICPSGITTLTASGAANYTWTPSATLSSNTGAAVTANPGSTTVYTVTGSSGICPASPATATVTIIANPVISVNSVTVCGSGTATLNASGAASYTWSPSATLSSSTGAVVTANPPGTTVYTISGSSGSCMSTPVTATVTVIPLPSLSISSTTVCASGSVVLTVLGGALNYNWSPATSLSTSTGSTVTANPNATTVYTVTGSVGTCTASITSTLTVIPTQSAAFSYASSNYCRAAGNPLPVITGSSGGTFTYLPAGLTLDPGTGAITLLTSNADTYTVGYTTGSACGETQNVILSITPTPSLHVNPVTACAGKEITLNAIPSVPGGNYNWIPGNTTGANTTISPLASKVYTVNYTLNGCTVSQNLPVTVNSLPVASVISSSGSSNTEGESITLIAYGGSTYLWSTGNTGSTLKVQPNENTNYCVTVTDVAGCKDSSCITISVDKASTLYVPNVFTPNGDDLNDVFSIPHSNISEFDIKLFNRWGELLFQSGNIETSWDGTYKGKEVADGVYVYVINAKGMDKVMYEKRGHVTVLH